MPDIPSLNLLAIKTPSLAALRTEAAHAVMTRHDFMGLLIVMGQVIYRHFARSLLSLVVAGTLDRQGRGKSRIR